MSATEPDTTAADIDVPLPARYEPSMVLGNRVSISLPGALKETMWPPGAAMSGFARPSAAVGPRDEKPGRLSSESGTVPRSSVAPTVITYGSSPGLEIV